MLSIVRQFRRHVLSECLPVNGPKTDEGRGMTTQVMRGLVLSFLSKENVLMRMVFGRGILIDAEGKGRFSRIIV